MRSLFRYCTSYEDRKDEGRSLLQVPKTQPRLSTPRYKIVPRKTCPLLKFLWDRDWSNAINRIETHPYETFYLTENSGRTALHLASFNHGCPILVADLLLEANPHALLMTDSIQNYTPLHYACAFKGGTNHLISLYCDKLWEIEEIYGCQRPDPELVPASPLVLASQRNAPLYVLKDLVSATDGMGNSRWIAPETGGEPYWYRSQTLGSPEYSPLFQISKYFLLQETLILESEYIREVLTSPLSIDDEHLSHKVEERNDITEMLRKISLLLLPRVTGYSGSSLHAVCALKSPVPSLVRLIGTVTPEEALRRDSLGYIPLHHVLLNPSGSFQLLSEILQVDETASRICFPGDRQCYPLLVAIEKGWDWDKGIADLVRSNPDALDMEGSSNELLPFLVAASSDASLTTIFELLRAKPHLTFKCSE